jgi:tRNA threonylcarbamoyladenosine biosynthesis protein TsaB
MIHRVNDLKKLKHPVILALETATLCGSVALVVPDLCLAEFSLQSGETHSRRLLAGIDQLLRETSIDWSLIDGVAVSLGPGSFTGLRIGLATAKGLVMASGAKLIGIGTLDALASQLFGVGDTLICPLLDARKKEIYCGFYKCDAQGRPGLQGEYMVIAPERLCDMIREPVLLLGDGVRYYQDLFREKLADQVISVPENLFFPRAAAIGFLALEQWREQKFLDPAGSAPIYIRPSEAELNLGK